MTTKPTMRNFLCLLLLLSTGLATSPAWADEVPAATPAVETGTLRTPDGHAVVYEVRSSGEPTLVFVHCWACDRSVWRRQVDVFAEDHRVVTFDLPGHGETVAGASDAGRRAWTLESLAADTVQLVEALDLDDFVFVGHSMGGPVALLAAAELVGSEDAESEDTGGDAEEEHTVLGIVCADTLHDLEMKPPEEQSKAWIAMFEEDFEGSLARMMEGTLPGEHNDALRVEITEVALAADRNAVVELMKDFPSLDLAAEAQEAGVPIRCINAASMQQTMPADAVGRNRRHADYELRVMEDVGHFLQLEKPAEFNEALREALASITAGSS